MSFPAPYVGRRAGIAAQVVVVAWRGLCKVTSREEVHLLYVSAEVCDLPPTLPTLASS